MRAAEIAVGQDYVCRVSGERAAAPVTTTVRVLAPAAGGRVRVAVLEVPDGHLGTPLPVGADTEIATPSRLCRWGTERRRPRRRG